MKLTLVVLAAGMGSRYGGLKQLDPVGPGGETILDYSLFDAVRSGFRRVVFIIRREFEVAFREAIGRRCEARCEVRYVHQDNGDLPVTPAGTNPREKPWGTGHAVWCARAGLTGPFAVINADDFYGADSFRQLADFLRHPPREPAGRPAFALIGFPLANTLSEHGTVSRGVCQTTADGLLTGLDEQTSIGRDDVGPGRRFSGTECVSMNCWAFTPALLPLLEARLAAFVREHAGSAKAEFYLPVAVSALLPDAAVVHVRPTCATWFGVTYREDRPRVAGALRELVAAGVYPADLNADATTAAPAEARS